MDQRRRPVPCRCRSRRVISTVARPRRDAPHLIAHLAQRGAAAAQTRRRHPPWRASRRSGVPRSARATRRSARSSRISSSSTSNGSRTKSSAPSLQRRVPRFEHAVGTQRDDRDARASDAARPASARPSRVLPGRRRRGPRARPPASPPRVRIDSTPRKPATRDARASRKRPGVSRVNQRAQTFTPPGEPGDLSEKPDVLRVLRDRKLGTKG